VIRAENGRDQCRDEDCHDQLASLRSSLLLERLQSSYPSSYQGKFNRKTSRTHQNKKHTNKGPAATKLSLITIVVVLAIKRNRAPITESMHRIHQLMRNSKDDVSKGGATYEGRHNLMHESRILFSIGE
jgi:hypothetical protein